MINIRPLSLQRGDCLEATESRFVGSIGAFSHACLNGETLERPLEVLLVEGSPADKTLRARLGDAQHRVLEGNLSAAQVSFTLEAFQIDTGGDALKLLKRDSASLQKEIRGELRTNIIDLCARNGIHGALLHVAGVASSLNIYGHTDINRLTDKTKTFETFSEEAFVEGWGNFSKINGETPFVHVHGTLIQKQTHKGGHFIMDENTPLLLEKGRLLIFPLPPIIRTIQKEDFPTWEIPG